jgi:MobA/VirD2-like, nuclease domain
MEFFPGAFENDWERRRAALLHDLETAKRKSSDLDWEWMKRRGGVSRLPRDESSVVRPRSSSRRGSGDSSAVSIGEDGAGRSMRTRFEAVARGSQPAVVKLASYGGGARSASMMSYVSRGGELAVETETGERIVGRAALADIRADWEHLFENRAESRDIGVFRVTLASMPDDPAGLDIDEAARQILKVGFGDRHFVYATTHAASGSTEIEGVVVLRGAKGERLTGDAKAAAIIQERFDVTEAAGIAGAAFSFRGYGNGVDYGTARVRDLVERFEGVVREESGRVIATAEQAGDLVQKEWRKDLHSRKGRDVMHLIVSARVGTDADAFNSAVREFLGAQFEGHRYVFTTHDPADDPKEIGQGGRRPHIHAHAIITMRSETGERIETSPRVFREWRVAMAERARENGIAMEMTDRREFASAPAFTRNQVRPVNYRGQTEHVGTSEAAQARYDSKQANARTIPTSRRSREYSADARQAWEEIAATSGDREIASLANRQAERVAGVEQKDTGRRYDQVRPASSSPLTAIGKIVGREEDHMRQMTRPEFEAYEKRVDAVLNDVEKTLDSTDSQDFAEVAAAARDIVDIRREHLELREQIEASERQEPRRFEVEAGSDEHPAEKTQSRTSEIPLGPEREDRSGEKAEATPEARETASHSPIDSNKTPTSSDAGSVHIREALLEDREVQNQRGEQHIEHELEEREPQIGREERTAQKSPAHDREVSRTDPPQQQVPRLRELEREIDEKNERERDGPER